MYFLKYIYYWIEMKKLRFFLEAPPKNAFYIVFILTGTTDKHLLECW